MKYFLAFFAVLLSGVLFAAPLAECSAALKDPVRHVVLEHDFDGKAGAEKLLLCKDKKGITAKVLSGKNKVLSSSVIELLSAEEEPQFAHGSVNTVHGFKDGKSVILAAPGFLSAACAEQGYTYLLFKGVKLQGFIKAPNRLGCAGSKEESSVIFDPYYKQVMVYKLTEKYLSVPWGAVTEEQSKKLAELYTWDKKLEQTYPAAAAAQN